MRKPCINHPDKDVYVYDPMCESIWCKECFEEIDKQYQQFYKLMCNSWNRFKAQKKSDKFGSDPVTDVYFKLEDE